MSSTHGINTSSPPSSSSLIPTSLREEFVNNNDEFVGDDDGGDISPPPLASNPTTMMEHTTCDTSCNNNNTNKHQHPQLSLFTSSVRHVNASPCYSGNGNNINNIGSNITINTSNGGSRSSSTVASPQQENWYWIESVDFTVGEQLPVDEGNTVDYKLTVFSDYMNFKTTSKEESQKLEKELISDAIGSFDKSPTPTAEHKHAHFSPSTSTTAATTAVDGVVDYAKLGERLTEYLLAFLNSNGGALVFGVRDDGVVFGMKLSEKQRDKIRLLFDNCIRNFQITPTPRVGIHYRLEFKKATNFPNLWILILEVKKSECFHYAHIRSHLKSWERLSASNLCLCDRPQRFVERLRELRNTPEYQNELQSSINPPQMSRRNSISTNNLQQAKENSRGSSSPKRIYEGYFILVFSDIQLTVSELILARAGFDKRIYRLESYGNMDDQGRFLIDRPSKYFNLIYQFLQVGYVSVKLHDWPVFLLEAEFYGLAEMIHNENQTSIEAHNSFVLVKSISKPLKMHPSISQANFSNKVGNYLLNVDNGTSQQNKDTN
ncbi:hypothetical protein C9374_003841 [Naegleria lovaniensis]|uniref:Schlafen AlbA-2 domain-containing protein n=1 Tax=Naegleria lovaniensis TaxID=51637 RepID=A0AA88H8K3_NAELO|nr:uncharacterized protein C9374_003841 [Naegleria lovaniensis]KAG2394077.1 hypothetical protein C9374_003841 [Naegleria lovaniensis]